MPGERPVPQAVPPITAELVATLAAEHGPQGPTEEHLVEELAGIVWRKRRLRLVEAAAHRRGLDDTLAPWRETAKAALVHLGEADPSWRVAEAIRATAADTHTDLPEDEAMTRRALDHLLGTECNDAYEAALAALREGTRAWWADALARDPDDRDEDEAPATADAAGLRRFLEGELLPWLAARKEELANRPLVREQAFGRRSTRTSWSGSAATRSTSTASSNGRWSCCWAFGNSVTRLSLADPFGKPAPWRRGSFPGSSGCRYLPRPAAASAADGADPILGPRPDAPKRRRGITGARPVRSPTRGGHLWDCQGEL